MARYELVRIWTNGADQKMSRYLQIWCLSLINNKPHQDVELLVEWERLPGKSERI